MLLNRVNGKCQIKGVCMCFSKNLFWLGMIVFINLSACTGSRGQAANEKNPSHAGEVLMSFPEHAEARGETRARLERAYNRLCSPPLDYHQFVLADVHFHLNRRFTNYSGDISGRMLGSLTAAGPSIGQNTSMTDILADSFPYHQHPDGHFGARQNLAESIDQTRDMPILWGNGRLLLALAQQCRQNPNPKLLTTAKRLGEYVISTRPYYGLKENFERVGGTYASGFTTCYPSLIDGLVTLGRVTGEKRFYDEARFIAKLSLLDKEFKGRHSHGRLVAYRGMLDLDRFTGSNEFVDVVAKACGHITKNFLFPTGGIPEIFDRNYQRDEGCSEADWIRVNFLLWQATGDTAYLDVAECALQNHLLATQFSNGGFGHHTFSTLRDGDNSYPYGGIDGVGSEAYWCCSMHCTQILADLAKWGVLVSDKAILITWLSEVCSQLTIGEQKITVTTEKITPSLWKIWLNSPEQTAITARLRVPGWAGTIAVNGETHSAQNGWADIPCKWTGTLPLEIGFPNHIRFAGAYEAKPKENTPVRIFAGSDLFCLPDAYVGKGLLADYTIPMLTLAADRPSKNRIPVIISGLNSKIQQAELVPISQRPPGGCRFLFKARCVSIKKFRRLAETASPIPEPGRPIELMFACDGVYELYLNGESIFRYKGWQESPRVVAYTNRLSNVLAVKARSEAKQPGLIGLVKTGEGIFYTCTKDWSVTPCRNKPPSEWLTDPTKGAEQAEELVDLGGFGAPPWEYIPAHFAGTSARWFWPKESGSHEDQHWWLFRCSFELSDKEKK